MLKSAPMEEPLAKEEKGLHLIYDDHYQLCPILWGILEGCAIRYREKIAIQEDSCMQQGESACRFKVHFFAASTLPKQQHKIANLVLATLPENRLFTLEEAQIYLRKYLKYTIDRKVLHATILQSASLIVSSHEEWRIHKITSSIGDALVITV